MISSASPWSLTAALTPGGHHVRLYLETEGQIETILSKKDNFTDFYDSDVGPLNFLAADGSLLTDVRPRDPNVSQNDAGVHVMTWDNRDPKVAPGTDADKTALSDTFGLAFSVDGLDWTVYSNEMTIDGLTGVVQPPGGDCYSYYTASLRHVVPIFLADEQLRLYFTYGIRNSGRTTYSGLSCSTGTAISN